MDHHRLRYRPDVDGLRAVAVLLVLASHLDTICTGGYVGVDVFFVISGYLIGANILSEMHSGSFSVAKFYERRLRRILPAMLVMMTVASLLVLHYFIPSEVISYARSLLAALFSLSNFYFWKTGGYFDLPSDLKPLLHTWSLAVEEQFYLLFPLFLLLIRRWQPKRFREAIWSALGASFVTACAIVWRYPLTAFFFAPLRAWELLAGTVISQHWVRIPQSKYSRNTASSLGCLLILVPAFVYGSDTVFPGISALPAVLGTGLVIAAGETGYSLIGRALAHRTVVFVGLISYSVYLWHWPLIVFQEAGGIISSTPVLTRSVKVELGGLSLAVGAFSWWAVEQPFRRDRRSIRRRTLFWVTGFATTGLLFLGIWLLFARGLPRRFPSDALAAAAFVDKGGDSRQREGECFLTPSYSMRDFRPDACLPVASGKPTLLMIGDSHAAAMYASLVEVYRDRNVMYAAVSGCPPLWPDTPNAPSDTCKRMRAFLFSDLIANRRIDTILLVARWKATDLPGLDETIANLKQRAIQVAVVGPNIEFDRPEPRLLAFALRDGSLSSVYAHQSQRPAELDRRLELLARTKWHAPYISFYEDFCPSACPLFLQDSVPLLGDRNHLTPQANLQFARVMRQRNQIP